MKGGSQFVSASAKSPTYPFANPFPCYFSFSAIEPATRLGQYYVPSR